jgi:hypothetical protein
VHHRGRESPKVAWRPRAQLQDGFRNCPPAGERGHPSAILQLFEPEEKGPIGIGATIKNMRTMLTIMVGIAWGVISYADDSAPRTPPHSGTKALIIDHRASRFVRGRAWDLLREAQDAYNRGDYLKAIEKARQAVREGVQQQSPGNLRLRTAPPPVLEPIEPKNTNTPARDFPIPDLGVSSLNPQACRSAPSSAVKK